MEVSGSDDFRSYVLVAPPNSTLPADNLHLVYSSEGIDSPSVCLQHSLNHPQEVAALISFIPRISPVDDSDDEEMAAGEFIFVLDRSGSMGCSNRMELAKQAVQLFLHSLPQGSKFNIVSFGSDFEAMFAGSQDYSETSKSQALE